MRGKRRKRGGEKGEESCSSPSSLRPIGYKHEHGVHICAARGENRKKSRGRPLSLMFEIRLQAKASRGIGISFSMCAAGERRGREGIEFFQDDRVRRLIADLIEFMEGVCEFFAAGEGEEKGEGETGANIVRFSIAEQKGNIFRKLTRTCSQGKERKKGKKGGSFREFSPQFS